jgi:hypothetical protein
MIKMSTGQDSTLGEYRKMAKIFFGEESAAITFLDKKITESPNGKDEEVIAAESQMVHLLGQIHLQGDADGSDS